MTAPIGTNLNRFTGQREQSQVTNSYGGYLTSAGAAYTLTLPFVPHKFEWFRYTGYGTAGTLGQGVWFRDMPAAAELEIRSIADSGATGNTSLVLDTTNGITNTTTTGGFYDEHLVITGITTASPAVVTTSVAHNLTTNDRVVLTKLIGTLASQLNNNTYSVVVLSTTTFALYSVRGNPINVLGTYGSSGQVTKIAPALGDPNQPISPAFPHKAINNQPPVAQLLLGTAVMGANNDIIYFTAWQFNNYVNRSLTA